MCGIFFYISGLSEELNYDQLINSSDKCKHRGPDSTKHLTVKDNGKKLQFSFHRFHKRQTRTFWRLIHISSTLAFK